MSKKVGVMTDSNSGITQGEAKELGITVVPMPFNIGGIDFLEDINLTQEQFYEKLEGGDNISTSQPTPGVIMDVWDKGLEEFDELVYIPMSSGLSSSYETEKLIAEDYDGRVEVVNNQRIAMTMRESVMDALYLASKGYSAKEIRERLEDERFNATIYITLDTLHYLKKGGRITPAAAALGTLLKIKPVLQIQGGKLDAFAKARTVNNAKTIMINALKNDLNGRISENGKYKTKIAIAHTNNYEAALKFKDELSEIFPEHKDDIYINSLSLSVSCHIGPGALAVTGTRVVE